MQIDRTKFFALVATLGGVASACSVTSNNTTGGPGANGDASTSGSSGGSSSGGGSSSSGGGADSGSSSGADSGGSSGSSDASGEASTEASSDASAEAAPDAVADGGGDSAACYGDLGTIPTCPTPPGGSTCSWELTYCTSVIQSVLSDVATAITTCIAGLPDCNTMTAYDCVRTALNGACSDSTADGPCSTIEGACAGTANPETLADCHLLVDGLNSAGRQKVLDCITPEAGTVCEFGLWSCIEGL